VIFVSGCNFRCGFCHNPELVKTNEPGKNEDIEEKFKEIKRKVNSGWYNGVCVTGGEPTLQKDLPILLKKLKQMGLSVKVDTNGSNPQMLKKIVEENLVDYVAMDIKTSPSLYEEVTGVSIDLKKLEESIELLSKLDSEKYEFRTTVVPVIDGKKARWMFNEEIEEMAKWVFDICENKKSLWIIQGFVSREGGEILSSKFNKENLPFEMHQTPKEVLERFQKVIKTYFPRCEIR